ncbi:MAG: hypothetical protein JW803_04310 [Endomicrobiales bacterium]|nr:hypothetical protein [Endomicrobiales bacterium]
MAKKADWPEGRPPTKDELSWLRFRALAKREAARIGKLEEDSRKKEIYEILDEHLFGEKTKEDEETAKELKRLKSTIKKAREEE